MPEICGHLTKINNFNMGRIPGPPCRNLVSPGTKRCSAGHEINELRWNPDSVKPVLVVSDSVFSPTIDMDEVYEDSRIDWSSPEVSLDLLQKKISSMEGSQEWEEYIESQAKFYMYSSNNTMLIVEQFPDASSVANEETWKELGRTIKKDANPIYIWMPTMELPEGHEGRHRSYRIDELRPGFVTSPVYDISQTEGRPVPSAGLELLEGKPPRGSYERLIDVANQFGYNVYNHDFKIAQVNGETHVVNKTILVNEANHEAQRVKTLAHELGHALLHAPNSTINEDDVRWPSVPKMETEAEAVAYIVCNAIGIRSEKYSKPYIARWAKDPGEAIHEIRDSANRITRASRRILKALKAV